MISLPKQLTVYTFGLTLDCGTKHLYTFDATGRIRSVTLVQHAFPQLAPDSNIIPGRLYFDDLLVPLRSELEIELLDLLRNAKICSLPATVRVGNEFTVTPDGMFIREDIQNSLSDQHDQLTRSCIDGIIRFVESTHYLTFADRVEQATDTTRYTVWVHWEPHTFKQVIVRLGRFLGVGMPAAKRRLESDTPLAEDLSALEVSDLLHKYDAEGLSLRIEPPFPWNLRR